MQPLPVSQYCLLGHTPDVGAFGIDRPAAVLARARARLAAVLKCMVRARGGFGGDGVPRDGVPRDRMPRDANTSRGHIYTKYWQVHSP